LAIAQAIGRASRRAALAPSPARIPRPAPWAPARRREATAHGRGLAAPGLPGAACPSRLAESRLLAFLPVTTERSERSSDLINVTRRRKPCQGTFRMFY